MYLRLGGDVADCDLSQQDRGKQSRFSVNSGALPQADGHLPEGQRACKNSARVRGHEAEGGQLEDLQLHDGAF